MRALLPFIATATLVLTTAARADEFALSLDAGAGVVANSVPAPYSNSPSHQWGSGFSFWLGARYALLNSLEVTASGFFEPSAQYHHNGAVVDTPNGEFPGTLSHWLQRFGAAAGARYLFGSLFRFVLSFELGWSHRIYSSFQHLDVSTPEAPRDYGLPLSDFSVDNLLLIPGVGLEWAFADHMSIAFLPRAQFFIGAEPTVALTGTFVFSYAWYL